ncbi:MAG: DUF3467 domain-containing protein [Flavobacteriaceae bacterium]|nr:DUF3467 domain-containing protein [Flavobacteriaceae bacterium]
MEEKKKQAQNRGKIDIELTEDVAEGQYSNLAIINHSASEFVLDFVNIMPGVPKNKIKSRIILTPQHAKRLAMALKDNIRKFEEAYGEIKDYDKPVVPMSFGPQGHA